MEILQSPFEYNIQLLADTEPSILIGTIFLVLGIGTYFAVFFLAKKLEERKAIITSDKKKMILQNMILMKTIQEEMDIEMKEALIREELRSKK